MNCGRLYNGRSAAFDRNDSKVVPAMWKNLWDFRSLWRGGLYNIKMYTCATICGIYRNIYTCICLSHSCLFFYILVLGWSISGKTLKTRWRWLRLVRPTGRLCGQSHKEKTPFLPTGSCFILYSFNHRHVLFGGDKGKTNVHRPLPWGNRVWAVVDMISPAQLPAPCSHHLPAGNIFRGSQPLVSDWQPRLSPDSYVRF